MFSLKSASVSMRMPKCWLCASKLGAHKYILKCDPYFYNNTTHCNTMTSSYLPITFHCGPNARIVNMVMITLIVFSLIICFGLKREAFENCQWRVVAAQWSLADIPFTAVVPLGLCAFISTCETTTASRRDNYFQTLTIEHD